MCHAAKSLVHMIAEELMTEAATLVLEVQHEALLGTARQERVVVEHANNTYESASNLIKRSVFPSKKMLSRALKWPFSLGAAPLNPAALFGR